MCKAVFNSHELGMYSIALLILGVMFLLTPVKGVFVEEPKILSLKNKIRGLES